MEEEVLVPVNTLVVVDSQVSGFEDVSRPEKKLVVQV